MRARARHLMIAHMTRSLASLTLPSAQETDALGRALSGVAQPGDCILLSGQIGAGKSALARAFIRARLGENTEVPSPTFTLVQTYDDPTGIEIWHADLYRLGDPQEAVELGLVDAFETSICLLEWPELIEDLVPDSCLRVTLSVTPDAHIATFDYKDTWSKRIAGLIEDA